MSPTRDSTLAGLQQKIDDLQRQLAERSAERDEALAQQTATAEVLEIINSSPGDLIPVFDAMLERAMRLCSVAVGSLELYDGERFRAVAVRGLSDAFADMLRSGYPASENPATRPLIEGGRFTHIHDLAETEYPITRSSAEFDAARTLLCVPLRRENQLLGMIASARKEVRPFSEKEIALLENFAAQAVIAMENARLLGELQQRTGDLEESLEYQTATSDVLKVISGSASDAQPAFQMIIETAARLCDADHAFISNREGDGFRMVASFSVSPEYDALARGLFLPATRNTLTGRTALEGRTIHITDLASDPEYNLPEVVKLGVSRTALGVPLLREETVVGTINLARNRVQPFTDRQIELVATFADQAVIALENAQLITETREALEQQTATAEVLQVINSSLTDTQPVFDAIVQSGLKLFPSALIAVVLPNNGQVVAVAVAEPDPARAEAWRRRFPVPLDREYMHSAAIVDRKVIDIPDVEKAPAEFAVGSRTFLASGYRAITIVPMLRRDAAIGALSVVRHAPGPLSAEQVGVLKTFANQAVIAIENARLLDELRQRTDEVAGLNRRLEARVAEQVDELGRVGRLKRFLAPQLAELIVSQGDEKILESHRREIVVVFCDLRGYTAFTETAEPEEVLDFLREYHGALGPLVSQFEGTLDQFSGDGIMVFFNDPVPIPDPAERAVNMAVAMREAAGALITVWRRRDRELGFGAGIAQGYATLGQIGFAERSGYTAIGTVCNLAARLCAEAKDGQILISGRVAAAVEKVTPLEDLGSLTLKGLTQPVSAFNVPLAVSQPALRVIEGGPPNG